MDKRGEQLVRQYVKLAEERRPLEVYWEDAYRYTDPKRGMGFINRSSDVNASVSTVREVQAQSVDTTALEAVNLHASTMYTGLTPKHTQWIRFDADILDGEVEVPIAVREFLQETANSVHAYIHSYSNFDAIALDVYRDIAICGMAGIYAESIDDSIYFEQWSLDTMLCQSSLSKERIDTVYRKYQLTAKEAVYKYGLNSLPDDIKDEYKDDKESTKPFEFIHVIKPRLNKKGKLMKGKRPTTMPYESTYIHKDTGHIVKESGFKYFPLAIPRWTLIKDTDYAVGQIDNALADIKMLNKYHKLHIRALEKDVDPPLLTKNDNVVNPRTVKIGPNRIIPVADMGNLKPLDGRTNFSVSNAWIEQKQNQIKRVMMADILAPLDKDNMTATEVRSRTQLMRQLTGPAYNRLQTELLQPLVQLVVNVLSEMNVLPSAPQEIGKRNVKPVFQSQQARIQRMEEIDSMNEFEAVDMAGMLSMDQSVADIYDFDKAAAYKAELRGVPASVLRSADEVKKLRKQREVQMQAMQAMQAQQGGDPKVL